MVTVILCFFVGDSEIGSGWETDKRAETCLGDVGKFFFGGEVTAILRFFVGDSGIGSELFVESTVRTMVRVFAKSFWFRQEDCWATFSDKSLLRSCWDAKYAQTAGKPVESGPRLYPDPGAVLAWTLMKSAIAAS